MGLQTDINAKMRAILIDWLTEVHLKFELMPETLYLTINIVDRFLSMKVVPRRELQLVGISSMLLASKYEEIWAPEVSLVLLDTTTHWLYNIPSFSLVIFNNHIASVNVMLQVNDFVCISDNAYVKTQILAMEKTILGKLGWYLTVPTPYVFLVRYIKASLPADEEVKIVLLTLY